MKFSQEWFRSAVEQCKTILIVVYIDETYFYFVLIRDSLFDQNEFC